MKFNWNFLGGGGCKTKTFHGGSMDIFWKCTIYNNYYCDFKLNINQTLGSQYTEAVRVPTFCQVLLKIFFASH